MSVIKIILPSRKEAIYIGANAVNSARQAGNTTGVAYAKAGIYAGHLKTDKNVLDNYTDRLNVTTKDGYGKYPFITENFPYGNVILQTDDGTYIEFIDTKIDITKQNTIKSTALVNRKGTVKEFVQAQDYAITLDGSLVGEGTTPDTAKFPYDNLKLLNDILSVSQSLKISSAYLSIFDINRVVLNNATFKQSSQKHVNIMNFTLSLLSDDDYSFIEEEGGDQ